MKSSLLPLLLAGSFAGVALFACSSTDGGVAAAESDANADSSIATPEPDAGSPVDAAPDPVKPHVKPPPLPIVPNQGGPIIASPEIVTVTWSGDALASGLEAFDKWWVTSATWKTMMAEWGVGPGTYVSAVRLPTAAAPSMSDDDLTAALQSGIAAGTIPRPNGKRIYMLYTPAGTEVTNFGVKGCDGFQAYHSAIDVPAGAGGPAAKAIYSITPRCASTGGMTALDFVTWGSSHEAMEAASDPFFATPAWRIDDQSLATPELGENADLCAGHPTKIEGHMITRNWSNVAAKAGQRPCVPAPPGPMFGIFAEPGEISVQPGKATTVTLRAYSAAPYPSFAVGAFALDPALSVKVSKKTAADGDVLTLTVTPTAAFVEQPGANLVFLSAQGSDYITKRHLIVHAK